MENIDKYLKETLTPGEYRLLQRQEQKYNLKDERVIGLHTTLKLLEWVKLRYLFKDPEKAASIDEACKIVEEIRAEVELET